MPILPGVAELCVCGIRRDLFVAVAALTLGMSPAPANAQIATEPQPAVEQGRETPKEPSFAFSFDKRPSLRAGKGFRLDMHFKSQVDWHDFPDGTTGSEDVFDLHRARLGVSGRVSRLIEYEFEREVRDAKRPWRDAFVNVRAFRALQVQLGRFKIPFSLDQTTGTTDLDFAYRSFAASYLAPSRDVGAMAHGSLWMNRLKYEAGIFRRGGDNARATEVLTPVSEQTLAARLVAKPWNASRAVPALRRLAFGAAFTSGRVPEGLNSLVAETVPGDRLVDRIDVNGGRQRLGVELQWRPGPFSIQSELMRVRDERRKQGIDNEDLPALVQRGWYISGTWVLTGEQKKDNVEPARPLLHGGIGALEIASRLEALSFGSTTLDATPAPGPRARRILPASNAAWTLGLNWYVNQFIKLQANLIREHRDGNGVVPSTWGRAWSRTVRVQFQL
jgi:phosphate-selective porin OprO and OprP